MEHFFEFAVIHGLAELLRDALDIADIDKPSAVVVKQIEDFINSVLRLNS